MNGLLVLLGLWAAFVAVGVPLLQRDLGRAAHRRRVARLAPAYAQLRFAVDTRAFVEAMKKASEATRALGAELRKPGGESGDLP